MLKTFEVLLQEAKDAKATANVDLAVGYSILKDVFKRQNFTVKEAIMEGKNKVSFIYTDPESKTKKDSTINMKFSVKQVNEKEKDKLMKDIIKQPKLSFTLNKYYSFIKSIVNELHTANVNNTTVKGTIAVIDEKQSVGRSSEYTFLVYKYDDHSGDFVDSYTIKIEVTK